MKKSECHSCLKQLTVLTCSQCQQKTCKSCTIFIDEDEFEILALLPESLQNKAYCPSCYDTKASLILDEYRDILIKAKQVNVYDIDQTQETYKMSRHEKPVVVKECDDKEETLLRLAFLAVQRGFNTIIDVNLKSSKSNQGGTYKKLIWSGTAFPVNN